MIKIFCDLDGCLTDFRAGVQNLGPDAAAGLDENALQKTKDDMYRAIEKAGPEWWANLAWTIDGKALWEGIKQYNPVILSSPGKDGNFVTIAEEGKKTWLARELPGVTYFLYNNKFEFAERDAILIDDMKDNVDAWVQCGGMGILHKDAPTTLRLLSTALSDGSVDASERALRVALNAIPESWHRDVQRIREHQPADADQNLVRERVDVLKAHAEDKVIKKPSLFLRDIGRILNHLRDIRDPKRQGLISDFITFQNDFRPTEAKLSAAFQIQAYDKAGALSDSAQLIEKLANLFSETYDLPMPRRRTVADMVRRLAMSLAASTQR